MNFFVNTEALQRELQKIFRADAKFGTGKTGKGKKAIVEFSSVNIAKPMHVGHLRNNAIGDTLANLYAINGYKVIRWNYLGDWGTQFGKLIAAYKRWGKKKDVEKDPITTLVGLYVRFHKEIKADPALEAEGRAEFKKLEDGDRENRKLWEWFKKESLKEFNRLYKMFDIDFDIWIGEAFFEKDMPKIIAELTKKGIAKRSEGALIIPLDAFNLPPGMVQKSDGASLYLTRDLANLKYRIAKYKPAKILYVIGNEQSLQLEQTFKAAELMGLVKKEELVHVKYGLVLNESGTKFSTREGDAVTAESIVREAVKRATAVVRKKSRDLSKKEQEKVAKAVAIGALKYVNLREGRTTDIVFDWDKMLDFSGDSAAYLQYTYARIRSIQRKAGIVARAARRTLNSDCAALITDEELTLIRKIAEFPHIVQFAAETYAPNALALYLYELANTVNSFYEANPILRDTNVKRRNARLILIQTAANTIKRGLELMGIEAPEKI